MARLNAWFKGKPSGSRRQTATIGHEGQPLPNYADEGTSPGRVRTIADLSAEELRAIEQRYGMPVRPRAADDPALKKPEPSKFAQPMPPRPKVKQRAKR